MISSDLSKLAIILNSSNLCSDTSALDKASAICYGIESSDSYEYNIDSIEFKPDTVGGMIPTDAKDLSLRLSLSLKTNVFDSQALNDPLEKLTFDIELYGLHTNISNGESVNLYSSWHLDKHIRNEEDGNCSFSHPYYHITFGGKNMEESSFKYESALIFPSPRIPHPPMDVILGIDFILQNFIHRDKIENILMDSEYIEIISRAQLRFWRSYFLSISSIWNNSTTNIDNSFSPNLLMPSIVN